MKKGPLGATPFCVTGLDATRPDATCRAAIIFRCRVPLYQGIFVFSRVDPTRTNRPDRPALLVGLLPPKELQASGASSLRAVAAGLNARGIRTPRGVGERQAGSVAQVSAGRTVTRRPYKGQELGGRSGALDMTRSYG
jgi:hypothetical protein